MEVLPIVNIVYATDIGYFIPTCTSLYSLVSKADTGRQYSIYILIDNSITSNEREIMESIAEDCSNVVLDFLFIESFNIRMMLGHISSVTYHRLYLHAYFPHMNKCVWIDGDTIVTDDIAKVFDVDIGENFIGGTPHLSDLEFLQEHCKNIEFKDSRKYLNAGVLIMNLERIRAEKLENVFNTLMAMNLPYQDQDILNLACLGNTRIINSKYNFMARDIAHARTSIFEQLDIAEISKAVKYPVVVHFPSNIKPWQNITYDWHLLWYKTFNQFLKDFPKAAEITFRISEAVNKSLTFTDIINAEVLVFYGAGEYCRQTLGIAHILSVRIPDLIWDKNADNIKQIHSIPVLKPEYGAEAQQSTLIVVCLADEGDCTSVTHQLRACGYEKIYRKHEYVRAIFEHRLLNGGKKYDKSYYTSRRTGDKTNQKNKRQM